MKVKELIKAFRAHFIPHDELKNLDKNAEVDRVVLSLENKKYYDSMELWGLRGLGPSKARDLYAQGVRLSNIKKHIALLPIHTQVSLRYDIPDRIPRELIDKIVSGFLKYGKSQATIVGSYRRGNPTSGDIDILYRGDIELFLKKMQEIHREHWQVVAEGPTKIAGIFEYKKNHAVEIDIWRTNKDNYHAMLLYSTGSKNHNILMRAIAKRQGMLLNQNGLYKDGKLIETHSEHDIYNVLKMKYRKPEERNL